MIHQLKFFLTRRRREAEEDYLPLTPSFERRGNENKGGGMKTKEGE